MEKINKELEHIKQDENGEEIVFEMKHKLSWWDCIIMDVMFLVGCIMIFPVSDYELREKHSTFFVVWCGLWILTCRFALYYTFYTRKNRIYITNQGIGFERKNWFRMQKKFFRFGEVGLIASPLAMVGPIEAPYRFVVFPLGAIRGLYFSTWQLKPFCNFSLMARNTYLSPKLYDEISEQSYLHQFLVKKTKEALKSQGIDTTTLPYNLEKQFYI